MSAGTIPMLNEQLIKHVGDAATATIVVLAILGSIYAIYAATWGWSQLAGRSFTSFGVVYIMRIDKCGELFSIQEGVKGGEASIILVASVGPIYLHSSN